MTNTQRIKELKEGCGRLYCFSCQKFDDEDEESIKCGTKGLILTDQPQDIFLCPECKKELQAREECQKEFEQAKQQATKELLEEVNKIIDKMETINYTCEEDLNWLDRDELKVQLSKLREEKQ